MHNPTLCNLYITILTSIVKIFNFPLIQQTIKTGMINISF